MATHRNTPKRGRGRPRADAADASVGTVQALDRGLNALVALSLGKANLTELSQRIGLPASTTHRLLATLQQHGMVEFDEGRQDWAIGIEAYRVGSAFLSRSNLFTVGQEVMRALMEETGETANMSVYDSHEMVFIGQIETPNPIRAFFRPGARTPMHSSGSGKAVMSQLDRGQVEQIVRTHGLERFTDTTIVAAEDLYDDLDAARENGWASDDQERFSGMCCVASAIRDVTGDVIGAISVSGPSARFSEQKMQRFGAAVKRAASEVTYRIGGPTSSD